MQVSELLLLPELLASVRSAAETVRGSQPVRAPSCPGTVLCVGNARLYVEGDGKDIRAVPSFIQVQAVFFFVLSLDTVPYWQPSQPIIPSTEPVLQYFPLKTHRTCTYMLYPWSLRTLCSNPQPTASVAVEVPAAHLCHRMTRP